MSTDLIKFSRSSGMLLNLKITLLFSSRAQYAQKSIQQSPKTTHFMSHLQHSCVAFRHSGMISSPHRFLQDCFGHSLMRDATKLINSSLTILGSEKSKIKLEVTWYLSRLYRPVITSHVRIGGGVVHRENFSKVWLKIMHLELCWSNSIPFQIIQMCHGWKQWPILDTLGLRGEVSTPLLLSGYLLYFTLYSL